MVTLIDTFVQYLATELAGTPPVHWVRTTPTDEHAGEQRHNALNVEVLGFFEKGSMEEALISLDLIGQDERQIYAWAQGIRNKLLECQYTPEYSYADPAHPVSQGKLVSWDGRSISFQTVISDQYYLHLNATFPIRHARA